MASDSISCPYCNAVLTEIDPATAGRRILCPRCGETFPHTSKREPSVDKIDAPLSREPQASGLAKRWSNRTIAFLILAVMGVMAILFLGFALQTEHIRREHDQVLPKAQAVTIPIGIAIVCNVYIVALIFAVVRPKDRPGALPMTILLSGLTAIVVTVGLMRLHLRRSSNPYPEELSPYSPVLSVPPWHLTGLHYLPADTNVIAAIHVADLLQSQAGRELLMPSGSSGIIAPLEQWIGLPAEEMDHVIIGLKVDDRLIPRLIVVVETLRLISKAQFKENSRRLRDPEAVRFPSDHTLVMGLTPKDLEAMPKVPARGINHLPAAIQTALRDQIDSSARIWAVGASDNWDKTVLLGYLNALPKETKEVLKPIQLFAAGLRLDSGVTLKAALKCGDDKAAQALEQFLNQQKFEAGKELKIDRENAWVRLQSKMDTAQIRQALDQMISVQKK